MSRILIISPGSPCRNPRPLKEAFTLGQAGHAVTLLTLSESPALDLAEQAMLAGAPFRHESVGRHSGRGEIFFRRVHQRLARQATAAGFPTLHALGPAGPLRRRALALPADLTIVHNEIPFWIGCDLMRRGRRVAADFEDWYSEDLLPADRRSRPLAPLRQVERELLRQSVYVSTTSHALSAALAARHGTAPPQVLTNSFPLQINPRAGPPSVVPAFFWFSQTLGPGRGLEPFVAAWIKMHQPSRLVLLGESAGSFARQLRASVPDALQSRLEFLGLVPAAELPEVIARHDIGLALELTDIPSRDLTVTNKILQYLNAGLAVLATGTHGQAEVLAHAPAAGGLIALGDPVVLAAQLDAFVADRAHLAVRQQAARKLAETHYCWEIEAPRLLALVANALGSTPSADDRP